MVQLVARVGDEVLGAARVAALLPLRGLFFFVVVVAVTLVAEILLNVALLVFFFLTFVAARAGVTVVDLDGRDL